MGKIELKNSRGLEALLSDNDSVEVWEALSKIDKNVLVQLKTMYAEREVYKQAISDANYYRHNIKYAHYGFILCSLVGAFAGFFWGTEVFNYLDTSDPLIHACCFAVAGIAAYNIYDGFGWLYRFRNMQKDKEEEEENTHTN